MYMHCLPHMPHVRRQHMLTHMAGTARQTMCQPQHPRTSWAQQQKSASLCDCLQLPAGFQSKPCNEPPSAPRQLQQERRQNDEHVTFTTTGNRILLSARQPRQLRLDEYFVDHSLTMLLLRRLQFCKHRRGACIVGIVSSHVCMQRMQLHRCCAFWPHTIRMPRLLAVRTA